MSIINSQHNERFKDIFAGGLKSEDQTFELKFEAGTLKIKRDGIDTDFEVFHIQVPNGAEPVSYFEILADEFHANNALLKAAIFNAAAKTTKIFEKASSLIEGNKGTIIADFSGDMHKHSFKVLKIHTEAHSKEVDSLKENLNHFDEVAQSIEDLFRHGENFASKNNVFSSLDTNHASFQISGASGFSNHSQTSSFTIKSAQENRSAKSLLDEEIEEQEESSQNVGFTQQVPSRSRFVEPAIYDDGEERKYPIAPDRRPHASDSRRVSSSTSESGFYEKGFDPYSPRALKREFTSTSSQVPSDLD
jgi:hypothetical protein